MMHIEPTTRRKRRRTLRTHTNPSMIVHPDKPLKKKRPHRKGFWIWMAIFTAFMIVTRIILRHDIPSTWENCLNLADHSALLVEVVSMATGDEL